MPRRQSQRRPAQDIKNNEDTITTWRKKLTLAENQARKSQKRNDQCQVYLAHHCLGVALSRQRQFAEAEPHFRTAFDGFRNRISPEAEKTLKSQHWLGVTLARLNYPDKAKGVLEDVAQKWLRINTQHRLKLDTTQWLARTKFAQALYQEAGALFQDVSRKREQKFGIYDMDTLDSKYWIARTMYELNNYDGAEKRFREVVELRETCPNKTLKATLTSKHWLAMTLCRRKAYQEAEKLAMEVLTCATTAELAEDHVALTDTPQMLRYVQNAIEQVAEEDKDLLIPAGSNPSKIDLEKQPKANQNLRDDASLLHSTASKIPVEEKGLVCSSSPAGAGVPEVVDEFTRETPPTLSKIQSLESLRTELPHTDCQHSHPHHRRRSSSSFRSTTEDPSNYESESEEPEDVPNGASATREPAASFFDATAASSPSYKAESADRWFRNLKTKLQDPLNDFVRNKFKRVRIAILDTGIDMNHDAFKNHDAKGKIIRKDFVASAAIVDKNEEAKDNHGHGTHCAGLVRKVAPAADLYIAKISNDDKGIDYTAVAKAIKHAYTEWDVDIISISFGFKHDSQIEKIVGKAVKGAINKEKLIFAAAANHGNTAPISYPAWKEGVFAINSADGDGRPSTFNPQHSANENLLSVLGEEVDSAWICEDGATQTTKRMTGTSVATPIAAGVAALVLQVVSLPAEDRDTKKKLSSLLEWLKTHAGMKDALNAISPKEQGYNNLVPWELVRGRFELSSIAALLLWISGSKTNLN